MAGVLESLLDGLLERNIRPGLENIAETMARCGNPEREFVSVHIAGTNGKGSVAAICESVLRKAGYKVGRYTSPHLLSVNERFFIDGAPAATSALERAAAAILASDPAKLTYFERLTAVAFKLFADSGVQVAVIETGLGGRFDATNLVVPAVSVITRIGVDHTDFLGGTIEEIAFEKAGIVKPGRPVVIGAMPSSARAVIAAQAERVGAELTLAEESVGLTSKACGFDGQKISISTWKRDIGAVKFPLAGKFQLENVATALAALERLDDLGLRIAEEAIRGGLETVAWPGRFSLLEKDPSVIVDGAHNPCAAKALVEALKACGAKCGVMMVAGFCADKDITDFLKTVAPAVHSYWAVPIANPRTLPAVDNAALARASGIKRVKAAEELREALQEAKIAAKEQGRIVVVCGSLFLVGEVISGLRQDGVG